MIFASQRSELDEAGYQAMSAEMVDLASRQPGFLGFDSVRDSKGQGITVSYWRDEAAALAWRAVLRHQEAQREGQRSWYDRYSITVCTVGRSILFDRGQA